MSEPLADVMQEAKRLVEAAQQRGVVLRVLGGTALKIMSPSSVKGPLSRPPAQDIDVAGYAAQSRKIREVFESLGYESNRRFNALHGRTRLQFIDSVNQRVNDVFLDVFHMCHTINLKPRLALSNYTLTPADVLLTKLQIVHINEKDIKDALCIINDLELSETDSKDTLNAKYTATLCANDWGLWKTVTGNLTRLEQSIDLYELEPKEKEILGLRLARLIKVILDEPKTLKWRARAAIGERSQWYNLPEAPVRIGGKEYEVEKKG